MTFDGEEIGRACDWVYCYARYFSGDRLGEPGGSSGLFGWADRSAFDVKLACWKLVHEGVEACLVSEFEFERALAMLCRKVGRKRVLDVLDDPKRSRLEVAFALIRCQCEEWPLSRQSSEPGGMDGFPGRQSAA